MLKKQLNKLALLDITLVLSTLDISEKVSDNIMDIESLILLLPVLPAPEVLNSSSEKSPATDFLRCAADTCTVNLYMSKNRCQVIPPEFNYMIMSFTNACHKIVSGPV